MVEGRIIFNKATPWEDKQKLKNQTGPMFGGFLDGDGSIMVQFKHRKNSVRGWRIMPSIRFYQNTRNEKGFLWIKKKLGMGYISRRKDHMSELRLDSWKQVMKLLTGIKPFIQFK